MTQIKQKSVDSRLHGNDGCGLPVKEIAGQRVITVKQIATLHKTSERNIRKNFTNNQEYFIEGTDFYRSKADLGKGVNFTPIAKLYFTESGYLMLVKSLTDKTAWAVQRQLVNGYFRASMLEKVLAFLPEITKKVIYYRSIGLTQKETGKLLDLNRDTVQNIERDLRGLGYMAPNQSGMRTGNIGQKSVDSCLRRNDSVEE